MYIISKKIPSSGTLGLSQLALLHMHLAHPMVLLGPATTRSENYWCTIKFKPVADGDFSDFCPNCENLERHILQQHQCYRCKCGSSWFSAQGEMKRDLKLSHYQPNLLSWGPAPRKGGKSLAGIATLLSPFLSGSLSW